MVLDCAFEGAHLCLSLCVTLSVAILSLFLPIGQWSVALVLPITKMFRFGARGLELTNGWSDSACRGGRKPSGSLWAGACSWLPRR